MSFETTKKYKMFNRKFDMLSSAISLYFSYRKILIVLKSIINTEQALGKNGFISNGT